MSFIELLLSALAAYLVCGFVFAIPFVLIGAARIDPEAAQGSWGFRLVITPGVMFLWPLLAWRWLKRPARPPEEQTAHRLAVQRASSKL